MADTNLLWFHFDEGLVPSAARQPWNMIGLAATTIQSDGLLIDANTEGGALWRPLFDGDGNNSEPRATDRAAIQWAVRGVSQVPVWASGRSPIGAGLDDKRRPIAVSVGPALHWIDPYTGTDLGVIVASFPWLVENTFRLVKERAALYRLFVNGEEVGTIPFDHIPQRPGAVMSPPRFFWGHFDVNGSSEAVWTFVEAGLNTGVPRQWKVDRARNVLPKPIQLREQETVVRQRWRSLRRTFVGMAQTLIDAMEEVGPLLTAQRQSFDRLSFSGAILPDIEVPPWTLIGTPGDFSIERQRVRIAASTTLAAARADLDPTVLPQVELRAAATFTFLGGTSSDLQNRLGPYMELRNGHRAVRIELDPGVSDEVAWALTEGPDAGPVALLSTNRWPVNADEPHRVEVQVLGRDFVLLLVDGYWVDCINYAALTVATAAYEIYIGRNGQLVNPISTSVELEDGVAEERYTDLSRRELFLQTLAERVVFTGGCERNDWLDTLLRNRFELNALRGSELGIVLEAQRLSCSRDTALVQETTPAAWYLDVTFPICRPEVYLDSASTLQEWYLELHDKAPNFGPDELAELARRYLVPVGVSELAYSITLAAFLTVASVNGATTVFTVDLPGGFAIGDTVLVRNAANTQQATGTIPDITPATGAVETTLLEGPIFPIGSTMRKILLET